MILAAGEKFTEDIARTLKIEEGKAEQMKRMLGFDHELRESEILSTLQTSSQKIIKEFKSAISYYEEHSDREVGQIILSGGSALIPKIDEYLEMNFGIKVILGNPLELIGDGKNLTKENHPALLAGVIGLALRGASDVSGGLNLLEKA